MKTFIIIVLLAGWNPMTGQKDLMIFPEPKFETVEECLEFATVNKEPIFFRTWEFYGPRKIQQVYCVPEVEAKKYLKPINQPGLET